MLYCILELHRIDSNYKLKLTTALSGDSNITELNYFLSIWHKIFFDWNCQKYFLPKLLQILLTDLIAKYFLLDSDSSKILFSSDRSLRFANVSPSVCLSVCKHLLESQLNYTTTQNISCRPPAIPYQMISST